MECFPCFLRRMAKNLANDKIGHFACPALLDKSGLRMPHVKKMQKIIFPAKKRLTNRGSFYRHIFTQQRRVAQVAEHFLDTEGVSSSSLLVPTTKQKRKGRQRLPFLLSILWNLEFFHADFRRRKVDREESGGNV